MVFFTNSIKNSNKPLPMIHCRRQKSLNMNTAAETYRMSEMVSPQMQLEQVISDQPDLYATAARSKQAMCAVPVLAIPDTLRSKARKRFLGRFEFHLKYHPKQVM
jgi:hypothetical protein